MKSLIQKTGSVIFRCRYFIIGFFLVVLYLFSDVFFGGFTVSFTNLNYTMPPFNSLGVETKGPLLSDVADSLYPDLYDTFYSGDMLDRWNGNIALGASMNPVANLIYPLNYVYLMPLEYAIIIKVFLEFFIGFVAMYLFMRALKCNRISASVAAMAYAFSSVIVVWLGWSHSDVSVLAPLLFYGIEKLLTEIRVRHALLCALVIYAMLVAGMPTYAAYFLYLAGIYIIIHTIAEYRDRKKNIAVVGVMFAVAVIIGGIMSLPYTYPLLMDVGGNGYAESRTNYYKALLDSDYLRTFVYPYIRDGLSAHINESTLYVGIVPLVLVPFWFVNRAEKKRSLFFIISSTVLFCFVFSDLLDFVYGKIPMINTSLKCRILVLLTFCISALAGLTLNDFFKNSAYYRKKIWLLPLALVWTVFFIGAAAYNVFSDRINEFATPVIAKLREAPLLYAAIGILPAVILPGCIASKKGIKPSAAFTAAATCFTELSWLAFLGFALCKNLFGNDAFTIFLPVVIGFLCVLAFAVIILKKSKIAAGVLIFAVAFDSAGFAKKYLPMISSDAPAIPQATDTVQYLCDNTTDNSRIVGIGDWTLFPNTPSLYGLDDIRAHCFVVTNKDITDYYKAMSADSFSTRTRVHFDTITNKELLKYLGVKYIYGPSLGDLESNASSSGTQVPLGIMSSGESISQRISSKSAFCGIQILFATYSKKTQSASNVTASLLSDGKPVASRTLPITAISDNAYLCFYFDEAVAAGEYELEISMGELENDTVTVWISKDIEQGLARNGEAVGGSLIMDIINLNNDYSLAYMGSDRLVVGEMNEYSAKAELAESVLLFADENEVLDKMKSGYIDNCMLAVGDGTLREYNLPLSAGESLSIAEYSDEYVKIVCSTACERYVMLNDYYSDGWSAYVNGVKTDIIKSNYLTRAVSVPAGENITVEFRYEPQSSRMLLLIFAGALLVLLVLFIFRGKLQLWLDRAVIVQKSAETVADADAEVVPALSDAFGGEDDLVDEWQNDSDAFDDDSEAEGETDGPDDDSEKRMNPVPLAIICGIAVIGIIAAFGAGKAKGRKLRGRSAFERFFNDKL